MANARSRLATRNQAKVVRMPRLKSRGIFADEWTGRYVDISSRMPYLLIGFVRFGQTMQLCFEARNQKSLKPTR